MGVELADRGLSSHYLELPLTLRERRLRLRRCEPPRHLEPRSGSPQGVRSVVVVLAEGGGSGNRDPRNSSVKLPAAR